MIYSILLHNIDSFINPIAIRIPVIFLIVRLNHVLNLVINPIAIRTPVIFSIVRLNHVSNLVINPITIRIPVMPFCLNLLPIQALPRTRFGSGYFIDFNRIDANVRII